MIADIYSPHQKNLEVFIKTDFNNRGKDFGGIVWEEDPVRHRKVAKKLSPAFSSRSTRAMEPLIHKYMDYFVARMKELGSVPVGVGLVEWMNWLAMDLSADVSWSEKMHGMRDSELLPEFSSLIPRY
jgi:cytochrome P450